MKHQINLSKWLPLLALTVLATLFAGCASVKEYSIRSYQGVMPMNDHYNMQVQR